MHTDRHIILATYEDEDEQYENGGGDKYGEENPYFPSTMFGMPIKDSELDFGRAKGQVEFIEFAGYGGESQTTLESGSGGVGTPIFNVEMDGEGGMGSNNSSLCLRRGRLQKLVSLNRPCKVW